MTPSKIPSKIPSETWDAIVNLMSDEIRENLVSLGIDNRENFLAAYLEQDPNFDQVLKNEFSILIFKRNRHD